MSDYPDVPRLVRGVGGAIRVRLVKRPRHRDGAEVWGLWDDGKRLITIDATASREHRWRVLFHELAHAAIADAGIENVLDGSYVELLCDAFATARLCEMRGELGIVDA